MPQEPITTIVAVMGSSSLLGSYFQCDQMLRCFAQYLATYNNVILPKTTLNFFPSAISGQSYKHFTLINYDSRVVITSKLLIIKTVESSLTSVEAL